MAGGRGGIANGNAGGGADSVSTVGGAGSSGNGTGAGGGGGGGGGSGITTGGQGGNGGVGTNGSVQGTGGAGGAGGVSAGANGVIGSAGGNGSIGGGGGGGGGGAHGYSGQALPNLSATGGSGGAGGTGGDSNNPSAGGQGGGGGAGGYGAVVTDSGSLGIIINAIAGGNGGDGGAGGQNGTNSGQGGSGGVGLYLTSAGPTSFTSSANISGGDGGARGGGGAGGAGIVGASLSIINSAAISGGRADGGTGAQSNAINLTGGTNTLTSNGLASYNGAINIASGASLTLDQTDAASGNSIATYTNAFTGAGSLSINTVAGRTIALISANTYTGTTTVLAGSLNIQNSAALGSTAAGTVVVSGAALEFRSGIAVGTEALQLSGTGISNGGALDSVNGTNSLAGAITLAASARINVDTGTLLLTGGISGNAAGRTLTLGGAGNGEVRTGAITAVTGGLVKDGTGTWTLSADNTYASGTTISAGTLQIGNGGSTGSVTGNIVDNAALVFNRSDAITFAGTISGTGTLQKLGAGVLTLSVANSYAGATAVDTGTLLVTGSSTGMGTITVAAGASFGGSGTVAGAVNVTGTISAGATALTDVGAFNTGALQLLTGATFHQDVTNLTTADRINVTGPVTLAGTLDLALGNGFATSSGQSLVFITNDLSDAVTGRFTALKINSATVALGGDNTFQALGHTYQIDYRGGDGNDVALRDVTFVPPPNDPSTGGSFSPGAGQTQTLSNVSSGSVTLDGPGTLVLTGTNTYTGPTIVNAGTLLVNGSIVSPTTVKAGGTLGGSGSTGTVSIEAGGTLSPGNSPGILSTKDLSLATGAVLKEEIGGTATGQFDQVKVVGTVSLNGAKLEASAVSFFSPIRGNSFTLIDNDGTDAVSGTFTGLTENATLTLGGRSLRISYHGGDGNDVVLTDVTGNAAVFGRMETSAASAAGAVYGLYKALLDRAPDPLGLQSFTTAIQSGASLTDVASGILGSPEHSGRPSTGSAYVESLYANVLNRSADAGGLAAFSAALASGTSAATVAVQIATSPEAQAVLKPVFDAGVSVPDALTANVARLYYGVLGRAPDTPGLQAFTGVVNQGAVTGGSDGALKALAGVAGTFLASTEYAGTRGNLTDAAFIDSVYVGALGRRAEAAGSAFWTDQLSHGASRAVVATQIAESTEAQIHLVGQIEIGQYLMS